MNKSKLSLAAGIIIAVSTVITQIYIAHLSKKSVDEYTDSLARNEKVLNARLQEIAQKENK